MSSRLLVVAVSMALVLVSCGEAGEPRATTTSAPIGSTTSVGADTTTTGAPTTSIASTTTAAQGSDDLADGSGCTPGPGDLPDGQWFGYVTSRADESIEFDLACWFSGDAAIQASAEDGEESPPPNDYYVRNANPATRTIPVGPDVEVVFYPDGDPNHETTVAYAEWDGLVGERGFEMGVWLEIDGGVVVEITEKWVP